MSRPPSMEAPRSSSRVEQMLQDTMSTTLNIMDRVRPPPARGAPLSFNSRPGEEEDVGLTSGKAVPRWRGVRSVLVGCCVAVLAAVVGLVAGLMVARYDLVDTDKYLSLIPFVSLPDAPLNFLVVGDWGRDGAFNQTLVAQSMGVVASQLQADFVVSTGDNFYQHGLANASDPQFQTSFIDVYTAGSLQCPWFAVLGNHDYHVNPDAEVDSSLRDRDPRWNCDRDYRRKFKACSKHQQGFCQYTLEMFFINTSPMIKEYWVADGYEPLNFTQAEDREHGVNIQLNMLRDGLESSDATWKLVVGHHPVYSSGEHGNTQELQNYILPMLQKFDVDMYLNGHDHNLELIQVPDVSTFFVTSGAGSLFEPQNRTQGVPGSTMFFYPDMGFVSASVEGPSLDLRFYDAFGAVLYNVTLVKRTFFVTSGAGSMVREERTGAVPGTTVFYHDGQGFVSLSVQGPTMDLRFYDVAGVVIYNVTLSKN